jgi:hypothetical protein
MTTSHVPDAVQKSIVVRCTVDQAFRIWTEQIDAWWPKGHSVSGDPRTTVVIEPHVGGRIFERTAAGVEQSWGQVLVWAPPEHFAYHWFLGSGAAQPTRVDVHFIVQEHELTRVEVRHGGPELIGDLWSRNSPRYGAAWDVVLPAYLVACQTARIGGPA